MCNDTFLPILCLSPRLLPETLCTLNSIHSIDRSTNDSIVEQNGLSSFFCNVPPAAQRTGRDSESYFTLGYHVKPAEEADISPLTASAGLSTLYFWSARLLCAAFKCATLDPPSDCIPLRGWRSHKIKKTKFKTSMSCAPVLRKIHFTSARGRPHATGNL